MKRVCVIGATGSVGKSVLDICERFPDRFAVTAVAARTNADSLAKIARRVGARHVSLMHYGDGARGLFHEDAILHEGMEGLREIVSCGDVDHVVFASSGTEAIESLALALKRGLEVSLANKESIVVGGPWIMPLVQHPDQLRPLDSEHSAVWQCIRHEPAARVKKILLTASGGPFRNSTLEEMEDVTPEAALAHPVWAMGPKITIDSATLMNKGIECIEAMQLFQVAPDKVGAAIHPKSQVHGMVLFEDCAMKMLLSPADMRLPAAAALAWPDRLPLADVGFCDLAMADWSLGFHEPDTVRFPALALALEAGRQGGAYPALLVGADEFAVEAFLKKRIPFTKIATIIEKTLSGYDGAAPTSLGEAIALVDEGYRVAAALCRD